MKIAGMAANMKSMETQHLPFAVLTNMWNGLSLTYSGQEIPNRKRLNFFEKDPIQWNYTNELHNFYKTLLNLRSAFDGEQTEILMLPVNGDRHVISFIRFSRLKQVLVVINLSDGTHLTSIEEILINGFYQDAFTDIKYEAPSLKNLMMEPWSYLVLEKL